MSDLENKCLDTFPNWLRSLGDDVETLLAVAAVESIDSKVRGQLVAGINYIFKSLDLIPDGIDDIGYLDDAFVVRVACRLVEDADLGDAPTEAVEAVGRLREQSELVRDFMTPEVFDRLVRYTKDLVKGTARGRAVDDIIGDARVLNELVSEVHAFSGSYECPSFSREEKNLIKLKAFFEAKLPR